MTMTDERVLHVEDPSTGDVVASYDVASVAGVEAAVSAAHEAFLSWRRTTPKQRAEALLAIAADVEAESVELAAIESREAGKPISAVLDDELPSIVDTLRFFAGAARRTDGPTAGEYVEGHTSLIRREPLGVVAGVTPWNYPLMMAAWKLGPAVAAGDAIVFKPSDLTPTSTIRLAQIAARHLPEGLVGVVLGAVAVGEALVSDPRIAMVALTGSTRAGRAVAGIAAGRTARTHLELGGNAPVVVFSDADLDRVAAYAGSTAFYNAGQDCTAPTRFIVAADRFDELVDRLVAVAKSLVPGPTVDAATDLGPVASAAQRQRILELLNGRVDRSNIVTGGTALDGDGWYVAPTVVAGPAQSDRVVQEELFGPAVTVQSFDDEAQALAYANGVEQGLSSSVWTADHGRALRAARDLDFGAVWINTHGAGSAELPHGGFGASGYGKDQSAYALEDYTRIKQVTSWIG